MYFNKPRSALVVVVCTLLSTQAMAEPGDRNDSAFYSGRLKLDMSAGYTPAGNLDWNISGPAGSPDVLSELVYKDLQAISIGLGGQLLVESGPLKNFVLEVSGEYGAITDGVSEDRDWDGSGRTQLYSFSTATVAGHSIARANAGLGYLFKLGESVELYPVVGWSFRQQRLEMSEGVQQLATPGRTPPAGPFQGLESEYSTLWRGGYAAVQSNFMLNARNHVMLRIEGHLPDYTAKAKWNLRTDLQQPVSFRHYGSKERGYRVVAAYGYEFMKDWQLQLKVDFEALESRGGTHRAYFSDGTVGETQLNEVNWQRSLISLGVEKTLWQ